MKIGIFFYIFSNSPHYLSFCDERRPDFILYFKTTKKITLRWLWKNLAHFLHLTCLFIVSKMSRSSNFKSGLTKSWVFGPPSPSRLRISWWPKRNTLQTNKLTHSSWFESFFIFPPHFVWAFLPPILSTWSVAVCYPYNWSSFYQSNGDSINIQKMADEISDGGDEEETAFDEWECEHAMG